MASTPHQCPGTASKVCNRFLPADDKDSHMLYFNCYGKSCTAHERCMDCHDWTDDKGERVSAYHEKLAIQLEKDRKAKSNYYTFFFFFFFLKLSIFWCYAYTLIIHNI